MTEPSLEQLLARFTIDGDTGCWRWVGAHTKNGYGLVALGRRTQRVHRVMHELFVGPIPAGYHVDHVYKRGCRYRDCGNPEHLEAVTQAENNRRSGAIKTRCLRGHEYTPANTYRQPSKPSIRLCRACRTEFDHVPRPKVVTAHG